MSLKLKLALENLELASLESEEVPYDAADEEHCVGQLTQQLQILADSHDTIEQSQVVSRSQVQELMDECGMVFPEDAPINSYTEEPSSTNMTITVESLWDKAKQLMAAIVKKAMEILEKIFMYIKNLLDNWLQYSKQYQRLKHYLARQVEIRLQMQALTRVADESASVEQSAPHADKLTPEESQRVEHLRTVMASIESNWANGWNDLVADVTDGGRGDVLFSSHAMLPACEDALSVISDKLMLFDQLIQESDRDLSAETVVVDVMAKLNAIASGIPITNFVVRTQALDRQFVPHPGDTIKSVIEHWRSKLNSMANGHNLPVIPLEELGKKYLEASKKDGIHYSGALINPAQLSKYTKQCMDEVQKLRKAAVPMDPDGSLQAAYHKAATTLVEEISAVQGVLSQCASIDKITMREVRDCSYLMTAKINTQLIMAVAIARGDKDTGAQLIEHMSQKKDEIERAFKEAKAA